MAPRSKDKISVQFVGNSAEEVTGSCILVETPHRTIILECGLYQKSGDILEEYKVNNAKTVFNPKEVDYLFVMHQHLDHVGRVPLMVKRGMNAPIIMPKGSEKIARILLEDCAKIMDSDAEELSTKYGRNYAPIYTTDDVEDSIRMIQEHPIGEVITLDEYVKFKFVPSGHILNAAQIELYITDGAATKTIAYTSDLGNVHISRRYINKFEPIAKANILIGESTYGGENRIASQKIRNKDVTKLQNAIIETCKDIRGRVLIPCFANARSQEMLTQLYDIFGNDPSFKIPVVFDTPMGMRVCEAYKSLLTGEDKEHWEKVMAWENIKYISDADESRVWQLDTAPAVIISSSGMLTHGRSRAYMKAMLSDSRNLVVFCGFSVENSLATIIKEGKVKTIKIGGKKVANRCRVIDLHSFSSHMQRDSLLNYYSSVDCEKVLLVHGDMDGKIGLSKDLEEAISKKNRTSKVVCVNKGYSIRI